MGPKSTRLMTKKNKKNKQIKEIMATMQNKQVKDTRGQGKSGQNRNGNDQENKGNLVDCGTTFSGSENPRLENHCHLT